METKETQIKWYDKSWVLILLLFVFPIIGVIGVFLHKTDLWKKLLYTFAAFFTSIILFVVLMSMLFSNVDTDYYERGESRLTRGNYIRALEAFNKVEPENENYDLAQKKILVVQAKLDSIQLAAEQQRLLDDEKRLLDEQKQAESLNKLIEFQKNWSDSIVSSWKGEFIIRHKLKGIDTIQFELSEGATEIFNSNVNSNLPMYQSWYEKSLKYNLGLLNDAPKTKIEFIPNQKLISSQDTSIKYVHPSLAYYGVKVYSGNQYYKEYLGTVSCLFTDHTNNDITDGNRQKVIIETQYGIEKVPYYKFRSSYWVGENDNDLYKSVNKCN